MIEIKKLYKTYQDHTVLKNINLFVQEGEIFGIIGRSGAGKSTLLRCMNLLERPDKGDILIDNQNITKLQPKLLREARHKTAMIFQQFNLLNSKTVYDNIALPMRIQQFDEGHIKKKINELLALVDLTAKINAYPGKLSGGQKQRVAIARALSCSPKILLCDEATSALDPETTDSILALLKKINQLYGITIILITHEMEVVKRVCHRLSLMENGKIIETIALTQVFANKKSIARELLYNQLSPQIPYYLTHQLTMTPNNRPLLKLFFEGDGATIPFISQTSRELHLDINILLANMDSFDQVSCGVLIVELNANKELLTAFIQRCEQSNLTVEVLGYVSHATL